MALPSGYTQLKYIQSSGTQHLDLEFKPNQNTRVVVDMYFPEQTAPKAIFGSRNGDTAAEDSFVFWMISTNAFRTDLDAEVLQIPVKPVGRFLIDKNKTSTRVNGIEYSNSDAVFQSNYNLALFTIIDVGGADTRKVTAWLYACQVYDDGVLIRDLVPAINSGGTVGMYDVVNGVFYTNAGTGTFVAGPLATGPVEGNGVSIIEAASFCIPAGKTIVDGTAFDILQGKSLVGGTAYDINLIPGIPISELAVGTSVFANVNGTLAEFIVINQGLPASMYDESCNGTWLLMKDIYTKRAWDDNDNDYANSDIHAYLNSTFLGLLDADIQECIKQAKIPYFNGVGTAGSVASGANGLSAKVFLLAHAEMISGYFSNAAYDGAHLSYFGSNAKRVAKLNGSAIAYYTRSPNIKSDYYVIYIGSGGDSNGNYSGFNKRGIRPAFIVESETLVSESDYSIIGL